MMSSLHLISSLLVSLLLHITRVAAVELTFELPDSAKECFHEIIEKDTESTLEFQVVTGGHYDVDVILTDPTRKVLYKEIKKQYDSFNWKAEKTGEYIACLATSLVHFPINWSTLISRLGMRIHCR